MLASFLIDRCDEYDRAGAGLKGLATRTVLLLPAYTIPLDGFVVVR